ncbi:MAG: DsrE/DsrF/DrsH-like family protein [Gammaproteobacteria bacterium]
MTAVHTLAAARPEAPPDPIAELAARVERLERDAIRGDGLCLLVFSGEMDKLLAAFNLAAGAAACGMPVRMFFTFWATAALRRTRGPRGAKTPVERMFGWLLPGGAGSQRLSRLDFGGVGRALMRREMRRKNVPDLQALIDLAAQSGVEILVCETSMALMGIGHGELIEYPGLRFCGVAAFIDVAADARATLFV